MSVLHDYAATVSQPPLAFAPSPGIDTAVSLEGVSRYDEVVAPDGALRPAWRAMASLALALTPDELHRVEGEITRFLADDGVTYMRRDTGPQPWQLDPVPFVLDSATWGRLELGLAQRAELLGALLTDLYGPQTVLSSGLVPSAAVFGHSGFARPFARAGEAERNTLLLAATDLGRDADGEWRVLADRVQAPSGLGFAMQNRRVISQVLPDLYQESELHRLEPYFAALRTVLLGSAPAEVADPRIVVLSPGTHSETAFDQAFLATALGFPLVQGGDLVVSEGSVWLKPVRWPRRAPTERIDVIVRRVDADWCDPLELRADSRLGVAGLSEAVRRGTVRLVNGLGAGVLENPALLPYLPAVCRHLLGEQLRIPAVPTWWCGDPEACDTVLARIAAADPGLIVRPIDQPRAAVAALTPDELTARIVRAPHRYVGQDLLPLSQVPLWRPEGGRADAAPMVFRTFTLRYGSAFRPFAGGLATVREHLEAAPTTKDVWVLKADPADADQGLAEVTTLPVGRIVPTFSPRALEDLFWAGRYAERTEDLLRLVLTAHQELDQPGAAIGDTGAASVMLGVLRRLAGSRHPDPDGELRSLLLDADRPGSAAHSIVMLREALEEVRDQLSGDTWRVFSGIDRATRALRSSSRAHRTVESASRMLTAILSFHGVTANMMRDDGWRMIETGRHLERTAQVCHLLSSTVTGTRGIRADRDMLEPLLISAESVVTHRRRYRGSARTADVLELLLLDLDNPRSVAFALQSVRHHLAAMPASTGSSRPERLLEHLETALESTDVAALAATHGNRRPALERFLADTIDAVHKLADAIDQLHFEAGPPAVALSSLSLIEVTGTVA